MCSDGRLARPPMTDEESAFSVSVSTAGSAAVVRVVGELDVATAPQLREAVVGLVRQDVSDVIVDLGGLEFVDSSGLSVLIGAHKRLREQGGQLRLRSVPAQAANVLRVTGLTDILVTEAAAEGDGDGD
jgi:anti-anti-sigma factor